MILLYQKFLDKWIKIELMHQTDPINPHDPQTKKDIEKTDS